MENLVRNAPPSLFKPKFSIAPSATSQNRILMEVLMKQPLPAQVAQPRMWLLRNVRNIRIISKKNKPHLSCVFLFSCVVPKPMYGHCMGSIGTGLFNWHFPCPRLAKQPTNPLMENSGQDYTREQTGSNPHNGHKSASEPHRKKKHTN